jgi:2-keto-4-pentenoate hydratase
LPEADARTEVNELDEAIREQLARLDARLAAGMPRAGWKICVNDARMQKRLGLETSFVGFLEGSRHLASGAAWCADEGSVLGVEPEFAIRFGVSLSGEDGYDAARRAIAGVAPAIEVLDWREAKLDLASLAATSSFHAGFVTGELRSLGDVPAIADGCPAFRRGDDVLGVPDASLVPADLVTLVQGVARFLSRYGRTIEAGDWLLCGACTNPGRVEIGDTVEADFGRLGRATVRFE